MEQGGVKEFIQKNFGMVLWLVGGVFAAGGLYAEFQYLQNEIETLERRLDNKIEILNELEERVDVNESYIDYHKGYLEGHE